MKNPSRFLVALLAALMLVFAGCGSNEPLPEESFVSEESGISVDLSSLDGSSYDRDTDPPVLIEYKTISPGRAIIAGSCADGATVYVQLNNRVIAQTGSHGGYYVVELTTTPSAEGKEVLVYAKHPDEGLSAPISVQIGYAAEKAEITDYVWTGKDSWLFFSHSYNNYYRKDLLSAKEKAVALDFFTERTNWLRDELNAELIYILVPNPNEIYGEYMPPHMAAQPPGESLHDQTASILREAGAHVIDMLPILQQHKNDKNAIYHHTDSHWTEYGAYFAYEQLFNHVSEKFPTATPRPFTDFNFSMQMREAGDLYSDFLMDVTKMREYSAFADPSFSTPVGFDKYKTPTSTLIAEEPIKRHTIVNPDKPDSADFLILRDSYSVMLFDFIAERSSTTTIKEMWDFQFDRAEILELKPDYVLYIICDMNLRNLYK